MIQENAKKEENQMRMRHMMAKTKQEKTDAGGAGNPDRQDTMMKIARVGICTTTRG